VHIMAERVSNAIAQGTRCARLLTRANEKTRRLQSLFGERQLLSATARVTFSAEATRPENLIVVDHGNGASSFFRGMISSQCNEDWHSSKWIEQHQQRDCNFGVCLPRLYHRIPVLLCFNVASRHADCANRAT
jgi:hypothetical protein